MSTKSILPFFILLAVVFYASGLLIDGVRLNMEASVLFGTEFGWNHQRCEEILSICLAAASVIATGILIAILHGSFSQRSGELIPFLYIFLVASNPSALYFTPLHIAALLLVVYMYCFISMQGSSGGHEITLISNATLLLAAFFFPPLIWLAAASFIIAIIESEDRSKFIVAFIAGLILPAAIIAAICYITKGPDCAVTVFSEFGRRCIILADKTLTFTLGKIAEYVVILIGIIAAMQTLLRQMERFGNKAYSAYIKILVMLLSIAIITFIFGASPDLPFGLLLYIPITVLLNDYIETPVSRNFRTTYIIAAILVFIMQRLVYII